MYKGNDPVEGGRKKALTPIMLLGHEGGIMVDKSVSHGNPEDNKGSICIAP